MSKDITNLKRIYDNMIGAEPTLASKVEDALEWLLDIEDFDEAEDSCNNALEHYVGMGRESVVYLHNGVIVKINGGHSRTDWEPYTKLKCFAKTELIQAKFGLVILQEELTLDSSEFFDNDVETQIEDCLKQSKLPYDRREITDENVGINDKDEWKLFDIPTN
jgi:hypothetical protein